jgi:hypothetical protein
MSLKKILIMNKLIVIIIGIFASTNAFAHEPIYGLGPETLPKHMHAIELGVLYNLGEFEYEVGYAYGITQNWTVRVDASATNRSSSFDVRSVTLRTKYALWRKTAPGVLKRLTAIAVVKFPTRNSIEPLANISAATVGIANGYESRRWYYFSDIGYTYSWADPNNRLGSKMSYNLVGGIRPIKSGYLKPDLVLLVEINGELSGKTTLDSTNEVLKGGNTLAMAPGFLLSYRNIMLKGGIQFGIANTKYVNKVSSNGLLSLEYHF